MTGADGTRDRAIKPQSDAERLEEAEERIHFVKLATDDTIWEWDLTTNAVNRSEKAAKFGHSDWHLETSVTWWEQNIHPDDRDETIAVFAEAIAGKKTSLSVEYRFCMSDGEYAHILDRAFIIRDDDGVATRAVGAMIDLTELRLVKLLLQKAENRLAYTSRLNAMGTMGSMLAHELSQPLAAAANYIRASRRLFTSAKSANFKKIHEALEGAEQSTLHAGEIIRRLREMVTRQSLQRAKLSVLQVIEEGCTIGLSDIKLGAMRILKNVDPVDLAVWADRTPVQQVIINIVRNAAEALATTRDPQIVVSATKVENFAEISIRDNGPGIADAIREEIFATIITTKAAGMGIGLSISRTIIEAQGGKIWVASSDSGGTEFKFTLPLQLATD